jgi:hypothetical protein
MDWLYALFGIFLVIAVAFLLGWTEKNVKNPVVSACVWVGSILLLLLVGGWEDVSRFHWTSALIYLSLARYIPPYVIYWVLGIIVFRFFAYRLRVLLEGVLELAAEIQQINARLQLLVNSLSGKLDDIASRLSEEDFSEE